MPIPDSQGAVVYWCGRRIGRVKAIKATQGVGSAFDCTSLLSPVIGYGANTRVVRQMNPVDIMPAEVSVELLGGSQFAQADIGRIGPLGIRTAGGSLIGQAYLHNFDQSASVGEKISGTAVFKLTGF